MTASLIKVDNLCVDFPLGKKLFGQPPMLQAVKNVSLEIEKGSFFGLVGESGSGKTTLGRAILGANHISSGQISFSDEGQTFDVG